MEQLYVSYADYFIHKRNEHIELYTRSDNINLNRYYAINIFADQLLTQVIEKYQNNFLIDFISN